MTAPRFARTNHGKGHSYTLDGRRIPGVTTAIGKVLDKPALVTWAANETARYAVDNWASLSDRNPIDRLEILKGSRFAPNQRAVEQGKRIHDLGERLAKGEPVEVPDDLRPRVEAYARFLDDWDIEVIATESPCCNTTYQYAGTFDLVAKVGKLDGVQLVMDIKTGKGVYSETALQLAAYARADLMIESVPQPPGPRGGKRKPLQVQQPMPVVDGAAVAHIVKESEESPARVDFLPVDISDDTWNAWLWTLTLYRRWWARCQDSSSDLFAPPIAEPLYPEQPNPFDVEGDSSDE